MNIINLNHLNQQQEIPKIAYRPFKTYQSSVYLEKLVSSKNQEWTEGIYELSAEDNSLHRIDVGEQVENPFLFDMEIPFTMSDLQKLSKHNKIYYSLTTQTAEECMVSFYEINLESRQQSYILTFSFPENKLEYLGMEMLTEGYFLFRLTENAEDDTMDFFDIVYLVDVSEKTFYRVYDPVLRMTFGEKTVFGTDNKYLLLEESYLTEEEQFEFLTSRDLELAIEVPKDFSEDFVHKNAVYMIDFSLFLEEIKSAKRQLSYTELDSIYMDGLIRVIGESKHGIYYKERIYDFVLKQKNDFMSRMMMGNEIIMELDKKSLKSRMIAKEPYPNNIFVNEKGIYKVEENDLRIEIFNLKTKALEAVYTKKSGMADMEIFQDMIDNYLILRCHTDMTHIPEYIKMIDLTQDNQIICIARDYFILGDTVFTI